MPPHQLQCVLSVGDHLITASATKLACFDSTGQLVSTSTNHKQLVRILASYNDGQATYLVSTGEDKLLQVSSLPSLELRSSRELVKRANALTVTEDGTIIVGDKFGDVYTYPLHAPTQSAEEAKGKEAAQPKAVPILGHVSMLNALAYVPADVNAGIARPLIVTGDRDEHVRVSRFPKGHVIENFLWGSKKFVSALTYVPASATSTVPLVLSAGGDSTVQCFNLASGSLVSSFPIESALSPYITVSAEPPTPVPAGRKKNKAANKGKGKGKAEEEAEPEPEANEDAAEGATADGEGAKIEKGLAVVKMLHVGSREEGGVIVQASGCTALLYVPYSALLDPSATETTSVSILDLHHPVLDICASSSTLLNEFFVTLDTARGATTSEAAIPLRRVSLASSILQELEHGDFEAAICPAASASVDDDSQLPGVASLYPVLSLLHHPGDSGGEAGDGDASASVDTRQTSGVVSRKEKQKHNKRPADGSPARDEGESGRNGKRAQGRAEIQRRLEAARRSREEKGDNEKTGEEKEAEKALEQVDAEMASA